MLKKREVELVLERALAEKGDFAELFFEDTEENQIMAKERSVTGVKGVRTYGAGLYLLNGTDRIYVYSNDVSFDALMRMAEKASNLLSAERRRSPGASIELKAGSPLVFEEKSLQAGHYDRKIKALMDAHRAGRSAGPTVQNLDITYFDADQRVRIANSEGLLVDDRRITSRMRFHAVVGNGVNNYSRWEDTFELGDFNSFEERGNYIRHVQDQIRRMEDSRNGVPVKKCTVPVVMEAGVCGTFFHECCGHMLEGCAVARGQSPYQDMLDRQVASEKVTLVDDGTMPGELGTSLYDDEGHLRQRNVLIEKGVLKTYMVDRLYSRVLGIEQNGCGRRQNYTFAPTCRMSNTFALPGTDDDDEMIRDIDQGLYIKNMVGGNGGAQFNIAVTDAFWIEKGEITYPVKDMMITGNGIEMMKKIDKVGTSLGISDGAYCGADSGLVITTTNQPRLRFSEMNLG